MTKQVTISPEVRSLAAPSIKSDEGALAVTRGGALLRVAHNVPVYFETGDIYTLDRGTHWVLSAEGYRKVAEIVGPRWENPDHVMVDGVQRSNPHIERLPSGAIRTVVVERTVVARAPNGNLVRHTATLAYDPERYFLAELFGRIRIKKAYSRGGTAQPPSWSSCGRLVPRAALEAGAYVPDPMSEVVYHVDDQIAMVVNLLDPTVHDVLANRGENQKFAERKAATICERLAMSRHPGFPKARLLDQWIDKGSIRTEKRGDWENIVAAKAVIPVIGWIEPDTPTTVGFRETEKPVVIDTYATAHAAEAAMEEEEQEEPLTSASLNPVADGVHELLERLRSVAPKVAAELVDAYSVTDPEQASTLAAEARYHLDRAQAPKD